MNEEVIEIEKIENVSTIAEINVGAYYQNQKVGKIFAKGNSFVLFESEGSETLQYRCSDVKFSAALAQFEAVVFEADRRFKNERSDDVTSLYITALRRIFHGADAEELKEILSGLRASIEKLPEITYIVGRGKGFAVWQTADGSVEYRYKDPTPEIDNAIAEYSRLKSLGNALLPEKGRHNFNSRLAAALHSAFKVKGGESAIFSSLERLINDTVQNEVKLRLLVITFIFAIVLMGFMTIAYYTIELPPFIKTSTIVCVGGIAGALISFLERSKDSSISETDLAPVVVLSSVSRIMIGGLFGIIAFAAARADLAFSLFKSNNTALLILAIAAGFSERLIPDVLGTIASTKKAGEERAD